MRGQSWVGLIGLLPGTAGTVVHPDVIESASETDPGSHPVNRLGMAVLAEMVLSVQSRNERFYLEMVPIGCSIVLTAPDMARNKDRYFGQSRFGRATFAHPASIPLRVVNPFAPWWLEAMTASAQESYQRLVAVAKKGYGHQDAR